MIQSYSRDHSTAYIANMLYGNFECNLVPFSRQRAENPRCPPFGAYKDLHLLEIFPHLPKSV